MKKQRNHRGRIYYTVAFHATKEIVTLLYDRTIYVGTTVLVVKSPGMQMTIIPIPPDAVDMSYIAHDHSAEIAERSAAYINDLSEYDKVSFAAVHKHFLNKAEFDMIPKLYRSSRPLNRGLVSGCWVVFTVISLIMTAFLVKFLNAHDSMKAFPLMGGLFCVMIMECLMTQLAFQVPLKIGRTYCIECIVIRKEKISGRCFTSFIIPEQKQYVDNVEIEPMVFDKVETNVPIKLYFHMRSNIAQYAERSL